MEKIIQVLVNRNRMSYCLGWFVRFVIFSLWIVCSARSFAVGDIIDCYGDPLRGHQNFKENFNRNPNNLIAIYNLGINYLCMDDLKEGVKYIKMASDKGHIQATYLMAVFYETDGTFDSQHEMTKNNLQFAIHYYDKADQQIRLATEYPYGIHEDMYYLEDKNHTHAKVSVSLPCLYFNQYSVQQKLLIKEASQQHQIAATRALIKMKTFAQKCLNKPYPPSWLSDKMHIRNIEQIQCQAMNNFADYALSTEMDRQILAKKCQGPINSCPDYQYAIFQLVKQFHIMRNEVLSVSLF